VRSARVGQDAVQWEVRDPLEMPDVPGNELELVEDGNPPIIQAFVPTDKNCWKNSPSTGIRARLRRGREPEGSGAPGLIEVVFWNGLGFGGIERGALVEVVGEGFLGDLVCFPFQV
jgi:hypothetical protein